MIRMMITGKMGAGKSTAAVYLADAHGASRWSRSETMKALSHALVDQVGDLDGLISALLSDPRQQERARAELLRYAATYEPEPGKPRRLYQDVTQIVLAEDPLCFERELLARVESSGALDFVLIDDVRNVAAFQYFAERGYRSVRINASDARRQARILARDGYLPDPSTFDHPSETELDDTPHDYVIENESDREGALAAALDQVVAQLRKETA